MCRFLIIACCLLAPLYAVDSSWELVFRDEFDGASLDSEKWETINGADYFENNAAPWREFHSKDSALYIHTGKELILNAEYGRHTSQHLSEKQGKTPGDTFACASIWSFGKFHFQYGYVEVRARFESAPGVWPAIWLNSAAHYDGSSKWPKKGEIDILEHLNGDKFFYSTLHSTRLKNGKHGSTPSVTTAYSDSADRDTWHTYGMLWEKGRIIMYLDGKEIHRWTKEDFARLGLKWPYDDPGNKFFIILSNQLGGNWVSSSPGGQALYIANKPNPRAVKGINETITPPESQDGYPGTGLMIDYVRVYDTGDTQHEKPE